MSVFEPEPMRIPVSIMPAAVDVMPPPVPVSAELATPTGTDYHYLNADTRVADSPTRSFA